MQEVLNYVRMVEKIYINRRTFEELSHQGKHDYGEHIENEIAQSVNQLPSSELLLLVPYFRVSLHKFSLWLMRLSNFISASFGNLIYIVPELFISIPFEVFRAFKRAGLPLYEDEIE